MSDNTRLDKLLSREALPAIGSIILGIVGLATGKCSWDQASWLIVSGTAITGSLVTGPKLFGRDSKERGEK